MAQQERDTAISVEDLKNALKQTLETKGSLGQIRARIRAEIFRALDEQDDPKPALSNANLIINELFREYLDYNRYRNTLSVFIPETGQPVQPPFEREFLAQELKIPETENSMKIPLLYTMIAMLQYGVGANPAGESTKTFASAEPVQRSSSSEQATSNLQPPAKDAP